MKDINFIEYSKTYVVAIGLINYPRFPKRIREIDDIAMKLAKNTQNES